MTTTIERETTRSGRQGAAVRLHIYVEVPTSANPGDVLQRLSTAAIQSQGVTITMPQGDKVDVDLRMVTEVAL